ncbi:uroporphyrinogen-III C-methyltransferase [filamentous cyanobacterium CCP5]|nr:uroporphyrinogen-III C-methyltransferase [filamentous cyanobacterium CCP5]
MDSTTSPQGRVYLVGAGPGAPELFTLQAQAVLRQAQVLVHDALVAPEVLTWLPPDCEPINVGKRGGQPSTPQRDIDRLLVSLCRQGRVVVRLKSGDPFIFGRTSSEIQALKQAGCAYELLPGLSSALVAPLLAGIPLTDGALSSGFAVVTAHNPDLLDWPALARMPTLVILMGGRALGEICRQLIDHGKRPDTPVAIVRWASRPEQQTWTGTLLTIERTTQGLTLSPAVIIVGEVVGLRQYLFSQ